MLHHSNVQGVWSLLTPGTPCGCEGGLCSTQNRCLEVSNHACCFEDRCLLWSRGPTAVRKATMAPHTLYPQRRNAEPSKIVPRKLGRGLVLLKRVPAQGLAKGRLSQPSQSLFTPGITSRHPRCALELSCCLGSPSLPVFPQVSPAGFQQSSYLWAAIVYMLISSIRHPVPGGQRPNQLPSLTVRARKLPGGKMPGCAGEGEGSL